MQIVQILQTKPTKPNLLNQTNPTKPNLPNQTYQTKPTKPNPPNQTYWSKQSTPGSVVPLAMFWNSLLTGLLGHYFQHKNVASYSSCWHHRWKGNLCSKNSKSMRHPACTLELFKPRWMVCLIAKVLNHKPDAFSASNTIHAFLAK